MALRKIDAFDDVPLSVGNSFQREYTGGVVDALTFDISGQVDLGGTATLSNGGFGELMPELTLQQGQRQILDLEPPEVRWLARLSGSNQAELHPTATGNDSPFHVPCTIDFAQLMPGAGINATVGTNRLVMQGRFGQYADVGTNIAAPSTTANAGKLRMVARTNPSPGSVIMVPRFRQIRIDIGSANTAIKHAISIAEGAGQYVVGLLLRAHDASAMSGGGLGGGTVDTLIRRFSLRAITNRDNGDIYRRVPWGQLQRIGADAVGLSVDAYGDLFPGMAWVPLVDVENRAMRSAYPVAKGATLELEIDNSSSVEERFASATAPQSGDLCVVTVIAFEAVTIGGDQLAVAPAKANAKAAAGVSANAGVANLSRRYR